MWQPDGWGQTRIGVLTPHADVVPESEFSALGSQDFEVVHSGPAGLPSDQQAIQPRELYEWVRTHTPTSADAVFVGGNGFRGIGVIKALEEALGKPLFVRSTRNVAITTEGKTLLDYGRRMLAMRDEAWASVVRPEMKGRVTIGVPDDYAS